MSCKHNWKPLYNRPTEADTTERRVDYLFLRDDASNLLCEDCGAIGYPSRGHSKGGGHKIYLLSPELGAEEKARAERWNNAGTHA